MPLLLLAISPTLFWLTPLLSLPLLLPPPSSPLSVRLSAPSAGIAVGFYGNSETCDGVNRLTYSLRHANRTVTGVQKLVRPETIKLPN